MGISRPPNLEDESAGSLDHAAERRGIVALHEQLGVGQALVIGDDLLLRAFTALADARAHHAPEIVLKAMEALGISELGHGDPLDWEMANMAAEK